jgi:hydrogenase maturation factor
MCLGSIAVLAEAWDEAGTRLGRLDDGCVVPLSFVPDAPVGAHLLVHLGIPVEVLDLRTAHEALALRALDRPNRSGAVS